MPLARAALAGVVWRAARRRFGDATVSDVGGVTRRYRVDPEWKRTSEGYAARLDTRSTIAVTAPVGRWRKVDPRRPQDAWRAPWKAAGVVVWASAVGAAWWLGARKGHGPLAVLHDPADREW